MEFIKKIVSLFSTDRNSVNVNSLDKNSVEMYNKKRPAVKRTSFCHAPSINLYFSWEGKVIACCFNQKFILGNYPEQSIDQIWNGDQVKKLRDSLKKNDLSNGCDTCLRDLKNSSFKTSNALRFDEFDAGKFPEMMEFQLTNTCNLECNMCNGWLSSTIRKNREQLPPLPMKYDSKFVEQLTDYIPHLKFTNFSGGEPFLMEIYYYIWDKIIELNPKCIIKITTNGTIYNNRVKELLEKGSFDITLSLDSLDKSTYESIRIGANFERALSNVNSFVAHCNEKQSTMNINFCPMVDNWQEIPKFLTYCNSIQSVIYFSIVHYPLNRSLKSLSSDKLRQIIIEIEEEIGSLNLPKNKNTEEWKRLRDQIHAWILENDSKLIESERTYEELKALLELKMTEFKSETPSFDKEAVQSSLEKLYPKFENENMNLAPLYQKVSQMTRSDLITFLNSYEIERQDLFSEYIIIQNDKKN